MNYRHLYHAGNFADVFKHTTLIALLEALSKKEKPWCYIESHAGRGHYDLFSKEAQKTKEYENGVAKFNLEDKTKEYENGVAKFNLEDKTKEYDSPLLKKYFSILQNCGYPKFYPGSPLIATYCARENDQIILIEKQPEEFLALKNLFKNLKNNKNDLPKPIQIHQDDGYSAMKAFLPPKVKRGLILIDPPYEEENEWEEIIKILSIGLHRFLSGVYVIWYPIKMPSEVRSFHLALQELCQSFPIENILIGALSVYPEDYAKGLKGSGLAIINPPWQFESVLKELLKELFHYLSVNNQGRFEIKQIHS